MAASELSVEQIHLFLLEKGGIVPNRDVVRHFRRYLTDPATQDDARTKFKRYVNTLATTKTEGNEKFLILRPKFTANIDDVSQYCVSPSPQLLDPRNAVGIPVSPSISIPEFSPANSPAPRQPPPYRPPPPVTPTSSLDTLSMSSSSVSINDPDGPIVPPRRRISLKQSESDSGIEEKVAKLKEESNGDSSEGDKLSISVKERTQKFNRMASVEDDPSPARQQKEKKKKEQQDKGADEDDGAAVMLLDPKRRAEWYVTAAKGDYHRLVKLASEEPRFVKLKDQFTGYTVLHWGAKHGNEDIIKHFAGTYKCDVNAKTNGGYTPLHIAAQFDREPVYDLLWRSYGANTNLRDYSGRTPVQYKESQKQAITTVIHSEYLQPELEIAKHAKPTRLKNQSFLRKSFNPTTRRQKSAVEPRGPFVASKSGSYNTLPAKLHN